MMAIETPDLDEITQVKELYEFYNITFFDGQTLRYGKFINETSQFGESYLRGYEIHKVFSMKNYYLGEGELHINLRYVKTIEVIEKIEIAEDEMIFNDKRAYLDYQDYQKAKGAIK